MSINKILREAVEKISMEYGVRIYNLEVLYDHINQSSGENGCFISDLRIESEIVEPVKRESNAIR